MNRMLVALFAAAATAALVATPLLAQSDKSPAASPGATVPLGEAGTAGMPAMHGRSPQGATGAMPWRMMMGHMQRRMGGSPQARCEERLARRAGLRAYVEAKLNLTDAQRPLWQKIEAAAQKEAREERRLCEAMKAGAATNVVGRLDRMQQLLATRLAGLQSVKPAVEALYQALTPEQRKIIDHPFRMP